MFTKKQKEEIEVKYEAQKTPFDENIKWTSKQLSYCRVQLVVWRAEYDYMMKKDIKDNEVGDIDFYKRMVMNIQMRIRLLEQKLKTFKYKAIRYQNINKNGNRTNK